MELKSKEIKYIDKTTKEEKSFKKLYVVLDLFGKEKEIDVIVKDSIAKEIIINTIDNE